jgi:histidinol dehydrogenase
MSQQLLEITRIDTRHGNVDSALAALRERLSPRGDVVSEAGRKRTMDVFGAPLSPQQVVERICADVRQKGVSAVLRYGKALDQAELTQATLRVDASELRDAHAAAQPSFLSAIRRIRDNILEFQSAILHRDVVVSRSIGVTLRQRYLPLQRVGVCVPGGAAAYPSTVLMTAVPAQAAGVQQLAVVAPPTRFGAYNADILATCHELGITEVYRMGGAQAVAALAFGVEGVPSVDKIVGPGNLFVALAKKHVYGDVDIDSIAGPSEVVVIADHDTRPDFTAADMLAQAEHAPGSSILITWSDDVLDATLAELNKQVAKLSRADVTIQSLLDFGAMIRVRDARQAIEITNSLAPEHLHIATENAHELLESIRHYGAAFLGNFSPVALGDYFAGPSHVLPTGATARWASGLNANSFLRASSVIEYSETALQDAAADVGLLADAEQLTAHKASVDIRNPTR